MHATFNKQKMTVYIKYNNCTMQLRETTMWVAC